MSPEQLELNQRDRDILRAVVKAYLLSGEPVSSRQLAKQWGSGLSAASIRNVLADLDELGLLRQPHTSAGRVPTAQGYHFFIDSLMETEVLSDRDIEAIEERLATTTDSADLASAASSLLSRLSQQVGIVVTPGLASTVLRSVDFVPLSGKRVLCVIASGGGGFIESKVIECDELLDREELVRVSNYLTENFGGMTLAAIRDRLLRAMDDERLQMDSLLRHAISLGRRGFELRQHPQLVVDGAEALLSQPELADLGRVRRMFETFSDKAKVVGLLNRCLEGRGVRVLIGEESDLTSELDFSLILRTYRADGDSLGTVGVFGPSRMEYSRLIPLVDYLGKRLSDALAAAG
jgi:heat-inducible transcriptional repressor